jgi:hypothetical protein
MTQPGAVIRMCLSGEHTGAIDAQVIAVLEQFMQG